VSWSDFATSFAAFSSTPALNADAEARSALRRIEALVATDAEEAATVGSEIARWQVSLALPP
jgi:hypothetical protein